MNKEEERKYVFAQLSSLPNAFQYVSVTNYIENLEQENKKYKEVIDKTIKYIDYNTKYRNGADIYQFVDIEIEILEPLQFILELIENCFTNGQFAEIEEFLEERKKEILKGVE